MTVKSFKGKILFIGLPPVISKTHESAFHCLEREAYFSFIIQSSFSTVLQKNDILISQTLFCLKKTVYWLMSRKSKLFFVWK